MYNYSVEVVTVNNYIVRADHYPDGSIIPLGYTNRKGETVYIDRVIKIKKESTKTIIYRCKVKNKIINLIFQDLKWIIEE